MNPLLLLLLLLLVSLRGPDFPISAHGHGNAYVSFCPFVYKAFFKKIKKKTSCLIGSWKVEKQKLSFQSRFLLQYKNEEITLDNVG